MSRLRLTHVSTRLILVAALLLLILVAAGTSLALGLRAGRHADSPQVTGLTSDRAVPPLSLVDEHGRPASFAAYRGRVVVFAPFLTLCSEVCPITTGALLQVQRAVARAGLAGRVVVAEVSVDPWRDTPKRLRAYARRTGVRFPLFTGSLAQLKRFWSFSGVGFEKVPQGKPPDRDWLTGKPLTFDVTHTDGVFFLDPSGHEKLLIVGMGSTGGKLPGRLESLLSSSGLANLEHPEQAWTVPQVLGDIGHLLGGRRIPIADR